MATNTEASHTILNHHQAGISNITFETKKKFAFVEIYLIDGKKPQLEVKSQSTSRIVFHLPRDVMLGPRLSLRIVYRHDSVFSSKRTIDIGIQEILRTYELEKDAKQFWRKSYGRSLSCELTVELGRVQKEQHTDDGETSQQDRRSPTLRPMTDQILEVCPHFRILVIGKTGAGKSSLINRTFGVNEANISHKNPGKANIETEIRSESNPQFILHDSLGFEHGEGDNLKVVEGFIRRLDKEPELRKKLHAIWICLEIPILGGRLLESGIETFLKLKTDGKLGDVPVIVVFTKYDKLVDIKKQELYKINPDSTALDKDAQVKAEAELKELTRPMEKAMKSKVPHVTVSTSEGSGYEHTLQKLIEVTFDTVLDYLEDASVVTAMAQKVSPEVKIRAVISVGKRKYWAGLGSSLNFPSYTLERCLKVIHTDIIRVWDFQDDDGWLLCQDFRALMANGVEFKADGKSNTTLSVGLSGIAALAGIVSALSGPAAPIVVPIAGAFVFAAWVREVYVQSQSTLRRLMTYIIDLILVTQNLFWIQSMLGLGQTSVTRRMIKLAFILHIRSPERNKLIIKIGEYSKTAKAVVGGGADQTFEEIERLIMSSLIKYENVFQQDRQSVLDKLEDQREEDWDLDKNAAAPRPSRS